MLPQVTKSLLDLEDLVKEDLKSIVQNAILLMITLKILKVILIEKRLLLENTLKNCTLKPPLNF